MKMPSERIQGLIDHQIRPPAIWQYLGQINQSVIALEIQKGGLEKANQDLVAAANQSKVPDSGHFDDCGVWAHEACDCPIRLIDMEGFKLANRR